MTSLADLAKQAAEARPADFDDPRIDKLIELILDQAQDLCVLRDRLTTAEVLHPELGKEIDAVELGNAEIMERLDAHQQHINALLSTLAEIIEQDD